MESDNKEENLPLIESKLKAEIEPKPEKDKEEKKSFEIESDLN